MNYKNLFNESITKLRGRSQATEVTLYKDKYHLLAGPRSVSNTGDSIEVYISSTAKRLQVVHLQACDLEAPRDFGRYTFLVTEPSGLFLVKDSPKYLKHLNEFLATLFGTRYSLEWRKNYLVLNIGKDWMPITRNVRINSSIVPAAYAGSQIHNPRPVRDLEEEPEDQRPTELKLSERFRRKPSKTENSCEGQFSTRLDRQYSDEEVAAS